MKLNKILPIATAAAMLSLTSCTDWLDQEPLSNITTGSYFKNASQFEAAANNLYSAVQGLSTSISWTLYDNGTDLNYIGNDVLNGTNGASASDNIYKTCYQNLRHCNNLLDQASHYEGLDNIDASVGVAYFFRAWWHFQLLQRYGGVTLALEVPQTGSDFVWGPRNSRYEVVASILSDLNQAQTLMAGVTKTSTGNSGAPTIEAVSAVKARVALFEGTWEKYNGRGSSDVTNGDGVSVGAGTAMPEGYPSVEALLTIARDEAAKFVSGGTYSSEYSLWLECEDDERPFYHHKSSFYLFNLEESNSNPYGVDKSTNNEAIFRKCYDFAQKAYTGANITHSEPCGGSRKLMDMFLCEDGLPINISPLFKGYKGFNDEFENRDARMSSLFKMIGHRYWSQSGEHGAPADYSTDPDDQDVNTNIGGVYAPILTSYNTGAYNSNNGYVGRKYIQERERQETQNAADFMIIRLPEMLLTYAEATFELNNNISDADLDKTINVIRQRAHIANLTNALVNTYGLDMKEEIRRERTLELYGEGFRFYDLCRWGIAIEELTRPVYSYYTMYNGEATQLATDDKPFYPGTKMYDANVWAGHLSEGETVQSHYTAGMPKVHEGAITIMPKNERVFSSRDMLQSIPTDEITLNSELKQNPQW